MNKILVTGSNGFLGQAVCEDLIKKNYRVIAVSRKKKELFKNTPNLENFYIDDLNSELNWEKVLNNVNCIVHCAAKVHQENHDYHNELDLYRNINLYGTIKLANQASKAGVKRFIYISSIKVNGEFSKINTKFKSSDLVNPIGSYSISKWEAEKELRLLSSKTGIEIVIIRPPLIYGPGVKGNFLKLIKYVSKGIPLPFGSINNKRSYVSIYNITDLIVKCVSHPLASNETFLVSDDQDISTKELIIKIAKLLKSRTIVFPISVKFLLIISTFINNKYKFQKLINNLQVDITHTKKLLGWKPIVNMDDTLKNVLKWYIKKI